MSTTFRLELLRFLKQAGLKVTVIQLKWMHTPRYIADEGVDFALKAYCESKSGGVIIQGYKSNLLRLDILDRPEYTPCRSFDLCDPKSFDNLVNQIKECASTISESRSLTQYTGGRCHCQKKDKNDKERCWSVGG